MQTRAAVMFKDGLPKPYAASKPLSIETLDLQPPSSGEVTIQVKSAGLCHSDLSAIEGSRPRPLPIVPGHECAGVVCEIGPDVNDLTEGTHVVPMFVASCRSCLECVSGRPNLCTTFRAARGKGTMPTGGHRLYLGSQPINHYSGISCFSEYAVINRNALVVIDDDIPFDDAALFGCAVITGVGAVANTAELPFGATTAVIGLGGVGLSTLLAARAAGASQIVAVDLAPDKLDLARRLGATDTYIASDPDCADTIIDATKGGVDYAFESAGHIDAMKLAYTIARTGGTAVFSGMAPSDADMNIPALDLVFNEKTVKGSYMGGCVPSRDIPRLFALYRQGKLPVQELRSGYLSLDDLNTGFDRLDRGDAVRQILTL